MAQAEATHHTPPRGQRTARAGGEEGDELNDATGQKTPPPRSASTVYFSLDDDGDVLAAQPDRLYEVRPQAQVGTSCLTSSASFGALSPDPEQVIEVPKILPEDVSLRTAVREPQLVEQLVEVPTIVSFSLLRTMERNVDIPAPAGGGRLAGLQGSLPGQSSTFLVEVFKVRPGQSSPPSSSFHSPAGSDDDADEPGGGVFRTFPRPKKEPSRLRTRVRECFGASAHPS